MDAVSMTMSRRGFVGAGAAVAVAAGVGGSVAHADTAEAPASWRDAPAPVADEDIVERVSADVVVVGAGPAGVFAACSAAEAGASVVLLEKMDVIGMPRYWMGAIGTSVSKEMGYDVDAQAVIHEALRYSDYRAKQDLIKLCAEKSGPTLDWAAELLAPDGVVLRFQDNVNSDTLFAEYPTQHTFHLEEDNSTVDYLTALLGKFPQIDLRFETPLEQLVKDESGRVTGVLAKRADGYALFEAAGGVVLCCGGYCGNQEMLEDINHEVAISITQNVGFPQNTGDGIRAGLWAGATKDENGNAMIFDRGVVLPGGKGGTPYCEVGWGPGFVFGSQPFLAVNKRGERFVNESLPYDYKAHAAWAQPDKVWIEVWDSSWIEDVTRFNTIGCSRIADPGNNCKGGIFPVPGHQNYIDQMIEAGACMQADTIVELAEKMGLPVETFVATVERYNELAQMGVDEDYGKEPFRLSELSEPPYFAITLGGQMLCTLDGLTIDTDMHVLDADCNPIEGLYAAGNNAGSFFEGNYPELIVGISVGRCVTFGRIAGQNAAAGAGK